MSIPQITLHGLATTSLLVSLLIAIFLPLRPLLRHLIGSQWLCLLWLALLMRLLMPWPLESRWSLLNRWQTHAAPDAAVVREPLKIKASVVENAAPEHNAEAASKPSPEMPAYSRPAFSIGEVLNILWFSGFCISLCVLAWRWEQTRRLAAGTRPVTDERLLHIFCSIPQKWRRNVQLRMTDALQVPTLAGIIHPQIWMPESWPVQFTDEELRNVLLHELGHARRGDLAAQWLFALAQCLHWFNPLVWFASRAARFDREMACDAWVLARNDTDHSSYGAVLMKTVQLLRNPLNVSQATISMASDRRSLHVRISGIGTFRPTPAWRGIAAIGLISAVLAVATTSRISAQEKSGSTTPAPAYEVSPAPAPQSLTPATVPKAPTRSSAQINIKSEFFEISATDAKKLGFVEVSGIDPGENAPTPPIRTTGILDESSTAALMKKLANAGSVHLLSAPSVTTLSGQRAQVEIVRELRYPTEFAPDKKDPSLAVPTTFETRNVGIMLDVDPVIGEGKTIALLLRPQVVEFLGYLSVNPRARDRKPIKTPAVNDSFDFDMADLQYPAGVVFQPIFSTRTMNTSVTLVSGQSVLLGGLRSDRGKGHLMLYVLVTASIAQPAGKAPGPAAGEGNGK